MQSIIRQVHIFAAFALLAGCVSPSSQAPSVSAGAGQPPTYSNVGLEGVMGRNAATLTSRFGSPDLDVREGNARKLQFSNRVCVLDAYLYPRAGGEQIVTYIDARLPDGRDVDRASCVAALSLRD